MASATAVQPHSAALHTPESPSSRLLSLDVLRGITVAGMILVTDPGSYRHIYPQLTHAVWDNPTAADLIFPCFLVMVGISMTLSFAARLARGATRGQLALHAVRRFAWLLNLRPYEAMDVRLFASWLPPRPASLAWAVYIVLLNAALIYPLFRRRIFLRL